MHDWSLKHVSSGALLRDLEALAAQDFVHLARLLAHIGEVHARKLYRDAGQPDMKSYCMNVLRFSEDAAGKRIHVAGAARRIPALLDAISEGRLHLSGACEIAAHLTPENAAQLLTTVTHRTREQIRVVVAALAPRPDLQEKITPIAKAPSAPMAVAQETQSAQVIATIEAPDAPAHLEAGAIPGSEAPGSETAEPLRISAVPSVQPSPPRVTPRAPGRWGVQFNIDEETNELLEKAIELLGLRDKKKIEIVFKRALTLLVRDLERHKCAKTDRPRKAKRPKSPHTITAEVLREVWRRDKGQCTFLNEEGSRCPSRGRIHKEHVRAQGRARLQGETTALTAKDVRLLCEEHNQLLAERLYGAEFMKHKRESAKAAREAAKAARAAAKAGRESADSARTAVVAAGVPPRTLPSRELANAGSAAVSAAGESTSAATAT
jgi:hypothetical protein